MSTAAPIPVPLAYWDCGFESRRGHGYLCCLRCTVKTKGKTQDDPDKETSTDKVQREEKRTKNPAGNMGNCCECCVLLGRSLCDGPIPRLEES